MKHLLIGVTAAITIAATGQVWAQVPPPAAPPPQLAARPGPYPYPFNSTTPRDAYREGQINRWEMERMVGPEPQAFQGPPVDGSRGTDGDGGRQ